MCAVEVTNVNAGPSHIVIINGKCKASSTTSGTAKARKKGDPNVHVTLCTNDRAPLSERPRPQTASVMVNGGPGR